MRLFNFKVGGVKIRVVKIGGYYWLVRMVVFSGWRKGKFQDCKSGEAHLDYPKKNLGVFN
jgi:hypothetical protein